MYASVPGRRVCGGGWTLVALTDPYPWHHLFEVEFMFSLGESPGSCSQARKLKKLASEVSCDPSLANQQTPFSLVLLIGPEMGR